jgi:hypothetical protein
MANRKGATNDLTTPMGKSSIINRKTDNTMARRKRTKEHTVVYKTIRRKVKSNTKTTKSGDELVLFILYIYVFWCST